jgi:predicted Rossmann fold flavoprotein
MYDVVILGGGAAGVFAALTAKKTNPKAKVALIEKSAVLLSKVKISGGGRCNATHNCLDPRELIKNYPRGSKELLGPFYTFGPKETIAWFEERGVKLKAEKDGRMFPTTDDSSTIIDALLSEAEKLNVEIYTKQKILSVSEGFIVETEEKKFESKKLIIATGSSLAGYDYARSFGHKIVEPNPSLFTFNVPNSPLAELSGMSFQDAEIQIKTLTFKQRGPILITHFGFSGPAVLKLSAFAARHLKQMNYEFEIFINWLPAQSEEETLTLLKNLKISCPSKNISSENPFQMPKNFFKKVAPNKRFNDLSLNEMNLICQKIHRDTYKVSGKTTNKEEFVTAGGVFLKEVDFKTMESKLLKGLYFAGEVLDIDGITGGFNFQNAWTTGFLSGISFRK